MWNIEDQPPEYQAKYWRVRAERTEQELAKLKRRKTPPEQSEMDDLYDQVKTAQETIRILHDDVQRWKDISRHFADRTVLLENEGAAVVLKRERDQWKQSWRNATRRLADAIEHSGTFGYTPVAWRDED